MDTRHNQLVLLSKRVKETNDKLTGILKTLGWTREELRYFQKTQRQSRQCPFNKQHVVTQNNFKEHYRKCLLKSRNVRFKTKPTSLPSSMFFYKDAPQVFSFVRGGEEEEEEEEEEAGGEKNKQVDKTVLSSFPKQDYLVEELAPICTTAEKRAEYDAIVNYRKSNSNNNNNNNINFISSSSFINKSEEEEEEEEDKKQKRKTESTMIMDSKRRPKQYRVKMKIMTPTEIQRELINGYMQELNTNMTK